MTRHHRVDLRHLSRLVIVNQTLLIAICASFVGSFSASKLASTCVIGITRDTAILMPVKFFDQCRHRILVTVLPRSSLGCSHKPTGDMSQPSTVLRLLVVLSTSTYCSVIPLDIEVLRAALVVDAGGGSVPDHRDGDGRAMHPALPLGRRNTLDAMSTGFRIKAGNTGAFKLDCKGLVSGARIRTFRRAGLSTLAEGEASVGGGEVRHEKSGIGAAFSGPDLDGASFLHDRFLQGHDMVPRTIYHGVTKF